MRTSFKFNKILACALVSALVACSDNNDIAGISTSGEDDYQYVGKDVANFSAEEWYPGGKLGYCVPRAGRDGEDIERALRANRLNLLQARQRPAAAYCLHLLAEMLRRSEARVAGGGCGGEYRRYVVFSGKLAQDAKNALKGAEGAGQRKTKPYFIHYIISDSAKIP